eukprot:CAMPEP_0202472514 /NCGR_PEP_ID=MMETSP1360-20130828/88032_1 /ASSEMBLY_ACC=CAM_ASM_000848 /TAXON_ID=515479 /ORGANISM="Licmophora paradoxa, Strain CCMP2313" /LENGTH=288 /DNA_ID=CAMNT_0049099035 /DNA_START=237 /DNA_END=1104 /DNA_ORIENTATION=-
MWSLTTISSPTITVLFSSSKTELTDEEKRLKFRDTSGGHPVANTGTYTGQLWKTEQTLGRVLLGETPFARCDVHSVMLPNNKKIINDWIFMEERDAVNVAVYTKEGKFLTFQQKKYAIPGETLSPVGGFINNGESPFDAARREVWEELGVGSERTKEILANGGTLEKSAETKDSPFGTSSQQVAHDQHGLLKGDATPDEPDWVYLGKYRTMANRGGGFIYTYLVVNAVPLVEGGGTAAHLSRGDAEDQQLKLLSKEETLEAVMDGKFQEIKWAGTMALGLLHMEKKGL